MKVISSIEEIPKGVSVVDFYADWCAPCKMMTPIYEEIEEEYGDKVSILKVDVDKSSEFAESFNVFSIPTFIIFKDGKEVGRTTGAGTKENLVKFINENIG